METVHSLLEITREQFGEAALSIIHGPEDTSLVIPGWSAKDIIDDLFTIARMVNANTQTPEIAAPQRIDDISQAVVTGMASPLLKARGTQRQVKIVMRDQDGLGGDNQIAS